MMYRDRKEFYKVKSEPKILEENTKVKVESAFVKDPQSVNKVVVNSQKSVKTTEAKKIDSIPVSAS